MHATANPATYTDPITPRGLPEFASFAISRATEPVPPLAHGEEALITTAMVPSRREAIARGRFAAHTALRSLRLDGGPLLSGAHREPLWPEGVRGSISHTADTAVALVASSADTDGVGIDIEQRQSTTELWGEVLRAEEREWILRLRPHDRESATLSVFSAKESIFKAFFPRHGEFFGFETASLIPTESGFVARLADGFDDDYPPGRTFPVSGAWFDDVVLTWVVLPRTDATNEAATKHRHVGGPSRDWYLPAHRSIDQRGDQ